MLLVLVSLTSCIEEYNELPEGTAERMVSIEGQIVSESDCTFSLRYTAALSEAATQPDLVITEASVKVMGSDGTQMQGYEQPNAPGHYVVKVGRLDPAVQYHLQVETPEGTYASQPMQPLDAPDITELSFEQPRDDKQIDFYISTDDPGRLSFYRWEFRETWEVYTPFKNYWEYVFDSPEAFANWKPDIKDMPVPTGHIESVRPENQKDHGWATYRNRESIIASNTDYGQGVITRLCLYQRNPDDNRFQTRYLTQIRQMAISAEEYEYLHLLATQSTQMGGLFTQMPSELPGNITSTGGERAVGYIGVRGHVSEAEIYVNRKEVGHRDLYRVVEVPDSLVEEPPFMLKKGYRIIDYDPYMGKVRWSNRWMVDCTDPFWGATLVRPLYWKDEEK